MNTCHIVDYGRGNLLSVYRAVERCGARAELTSDPERVKRAERLVLPGVGAFGDAMDELRRLDLIEPIVEFSTTGRPFLGICLGMQMMFDRSSEFGSHEGLGLVPGDVRAIPRDIVNGRRYKIPHIGWNKLIPTNGSACYADTILEGLSDTASCYFVHSFTAVPANDNHRIADCRYADHDLCAVVNRDGLWGCQFHPEKSGEIGLKIFGNFLRR